MSFPTGSEILSPSNAADDRVRKRRLYAAHGLRSYWLLDPHERTLEALRLDLDTETWAESGSFDGESVARIPPFEAITMHVGQLFPPRP